MKKLCALLALVILCGLGLAWRKNELQSVAQAQTPAAPSGANQCGKVGNNLATMFSGYNVSFDEAQYTLTIYSGNEKPGDFITLINQSPNTVIIRLGASTTNIGPPAETYIAFLNAVAAGATRPFIATAGHNEPNCAEQVPLAQEIAYINQVTAGVTASNVTLISGQFDFYCGDSGLLPGSDYAAESVFRDNYLRAILETDIDGIAFPYYITPGTPTAVQTYNYAREYIAKVNAVRPNLPVYFTESGPFLEDSMPEFAAAVPLIVEEPQVEAILLFNALGINQDPAFKYTSPFWNPKCREALRTICTDVEQVIKICSEPYSDYYLYPIEGIKEQDPQAILNSLANQGYEVHCSAPTIPIKAVGGGDLTKFLASRGTGQYLFSFPDVTQAFDYRNAKVPLFRASEGEASALSSIEQYFGFVDTQKDPEEIAETSSALYSLLTPEQQCEQQVSILQTIETMCDKLENPSLCGLYKPIPDTDFSTLSLRESWEIASANGLSCEDIAVGWKETYTSTKNIEQEQYEQIRKGLANTPLYLDQAYRLAFLVIAAELESGSNFNNVFNFLRRDRTAEPRYDIKVIAFKFPDIGTNKDSGDLNYRDPMQLTGDILLDRETQLQQAVEEAERRTQRKEGSTNLSSLTTSLTCGEQEVCQDPLVESLLKMIASSGETCEVTKDDLAYEASSQISSDASIDSSEGKTFKPNFDLVAELFQGQSGASPAPQQAGFEFVSDVTVTNNNGPSGETKIRSFLIYPYGSEARIVENTIIGKFLGLDQIKELEENPPEELANYFKLQGVDQKWSEPEREEKYFDPSKLPGCLLTLPPNPDNCTSSYTVKLESQQTDTEPRVLGGRLSYIIRQVQLSISDANSDFNNYVRSCKTLEEYFLGQCTGKPPADEEQQTPTDEYLATEIVQTDSCLSRIGGGPQSIPYSGSACLANQGPEVGAPAFEFYNTSGTSSSYDVPNWRNPADEPSPCNEDFYRFVACTNGPTDTKDGRKRQGYAPALIAHKVDSEGKFDPQGSQTACEYVVQRARQEGISPRLALAMWGEESGFSAFSTEQGGADFGVISQPSSRQSGSIKEQVDTFLDIATNTQLSSYVNFLQRYSGEVAANQTAPYRFCNNRAFPARLYYFYQCVSPTLSCGG